jgi:hypothetical protein
MHDHRNIFLVFISEVGRGVPHMLLLKHTLKSIFGVLVSEGGRGASESWDSAPRALSGRESGQY